MFDEKNAFRFLRIAYSNLQDQPRKALMIADVTCVQYNNSIFINIIMIDLNYY
jgi:hypothetical protein